MTIALNNIYLKGVCSGVHVADSSNIYDIYEISKILFCVK